MFFFTAPNDSKIEAPIVELFLPLLLWYYMFLLENGQYSDLGPE